MKVCNGFGLCGECEVYLITFLLFLFHQDLYFPTVLKGLLHWLKACSTLMRNVASLRFNPFNNLNTKKSYRNVVFEACMVSMTIVGVGSYHDSHD